MENQKLVTFKEKKYAEEYFNKLFNSLNRMVKNEELKTPKNLVDGSIASIYYYNLDSNYNSLIITSPLVVSYFIDGNYRIETENYSIFDYIKQIGEKEFSIKDIEDDFKEKFKIFKTMNSEVKEFSNYKKTLSTYISFILSYHFWNDDVKGMLKMKEYLSQTKDEYSFKLDKQRISQLSLLIKRKNAPIVSSVSATSDSVVKNILIENAIYDSYKGSTNFYKFLELKLVILNLFEKSPFIVDLFYDFINNITSENITEFILKDKNKGDKYNLYYLYTEFMRNNKNNKKIDLKALHTYKNTYSLTKNSCFSLASLETNYTILEDIIALYPKDLEYEKNFYFWGNSYSLIEAFPMVVYAKYIKSDPEKFANILRKYLKDTFEGNIKKQKKLKQQLFRIDRMLKDLNLDGINLVDLINGFPDYFHSAALEILI